MLSFMYFSRSVMLMAVTAQMLAEHVRPFPIIFEEEVVPT
jgi:hypothetical protein